jgi:hypothetical protein
MDEQRVVIIPEPQPNGESALEIMDTGSTMMGMRIFLEASQNHRLRHCHLLRFRKIIGDIIDDRNSIFSKM